jgi:hypothetical protein
LHLSFEHRELRDVCLSEAASVKEFGTEMATSLRAMLADIISAETLAELVTGNLRASDGGDPGVFVVDLGKSGTLEFRANHPKLGGVKQNELNPNRISRLIVTSVEVKDA